MNTETRDNKIKTALGLLASVTKHELDDVQISAWLIYLDPYDADQAFHAIMEWGRSNKWFPAPSDIIGKLDGAAQPSLSLEARAELEAMNVLKMIRYHGQRYKDGWQDPVTARLMSSRFSYYDLCTNLSSAEEQWFVKEFKAAYCAGDELETKAQIEADPKVLKLADHIGLK